MAALCDHVFAVPSSFTPAVQQVHLCLYHYFRAGVETAATGRGGATNFVASCPAALNSEAKMALVQIPAARAKRKLATENRVVTCTLRVRFKTSSRITELSQHEANGREFQEREGVAIEIFPVLGEAAATVEPRNGAFDNPTLG